MDQGVAAAAALATCRALRRGSPRSRGPLGRRRTAAAPRSAAARPRLGRRLRFLPGSERCAPQLGVCASKCGKMWFRQPRRPGGLTRAVSSRRPRPTRPRAHRGRRSRRKWTRSMPPQRRRMTTRNLRESWQPRGPVAADRQHVTGGPSNRRVVRRVRALDAERRARLVVG